MYRERHTRVPIFMQFILVIVVLVLAFTGIYTTYRLLQKPSLSLPTNTTVVTEIQHIGKLETATYTIQQIIVYDPNPNSWWNFLGSAKELFVVYGKVTAGLDLSALKSNDVIIQGKDAKTSITLNMSATQILSTIIDPTRTEVYDADTGIYALFGQTISPDTTVKILAAAQDTLQSDACKDGILQQAADSAKVQLTSFLTTVGFPVATVHVSAGKCN